MFQLSAHSALKHYKIESKHDVVDILTIVLSEKEILVMQQIWACKCYLHTAVAVKFRGNP